MPKPFLVVNLNNKNKMNDIAEWLVSNKIKVLNIAGPRSSQSEKIYEDATTFLVELFDICKKNQAENLEATGVSACVKPRKNGKYLVSNIKIHVVYYTLLPYIMNRLIIV